MQEYRLYEFHLHEVGEEAILICCVRMQKKWLSGGGNDRKWLPMSAGKLISAGDDLYLILGWWGRVYIWQNLLSYTIK